MPVKRDTNITMATDDVSVVIVNFLNNCGIVCAAIDDIDGMLIPREVLLCDKQYANAKEQIPKLRHLFSSSYMTSLQNNASQVQTWPLINLVRQTLKMCNRRMRPIRMADGYTNDGIKKFKRAFIIEQIRPKINTYDNEDGNFEDDL